jgi:glycosyltransferase involved in cell wall biosynthesis
MLSFIIIGRNEGWKLSLCLKSVFKTIEYNQLKSYEVIYVDSMSSDDSISRAKEFAEVRIIQLKGYYNAAVARNIGAEYSNGEILFFIDGDMELIPDFLSVVLNENQNLTYPFMSGIYEDYLYNSDWVFTGVNRRYSLSEGMPDSFEKVTGGLFLIAKSEWTEIGGMDTRFSRSQDLDLGLRMSKRGMKLLRKPILAAKHHTQSYLDETRVQDFITKSRYSALLCRKHLFNKHFWPTLLGNHYSSLLLLLSVLLALLIHPVFLLGYCIVLIYKGAKIKKKSNYSYWQSMILTIERDFLFVYSLVFFFPKTKNTEVIEI